MCLQKVTVYNIKLTSLRALNFDSVECKDLFTIMEAFELKTTLS